ncbi:MAG: sulfurtransferase TusA family protein [Elusimicrobia bacterium]|nr:sulfurtransferase TusA family protein [Elusimicrobiota bacterium]
MSKAAQTVDLTGVPCPANAARALISLEGLPAGSLLGIRLDDGEPIANVPPALAEQGHEVVEKVRDGAGWRLLVRKGDAP